MTLQSPKLNWEQVDSSNVSRVAFHQDTGTLCVQFTNGGLYAYSEVSPDDYRSLVGAESVGRYLNRVIKPMYPYQRFNDEAELLSVVGGYLAIDEV